MMSIQSVKRPTDKPPIMLVILDGFGHRKSAEFNAIALAKTPTLDHFLHHYASHTTLPASGSFVGLPDGAIGNSQVGHMTIGCGRIIKQPITIMNEMIADHTLDNHPVLLEHFQTLRARGGALHLMGLLSDAGVHAHENHLHALMRIAVHRGISSLIIHPFLDGRDVAPYSATLFLKRLDTVMADVGRARIGSIHGRFYAMDRDHHWDRTEQSFNALVHRQPSPFKTWQELLHYSYDHGITDEFISPTQLDYTATVKEGDGIIFFNTRPDRARQLTALFCNSSPISITHPAPPLAFFISTTAYDALSCASTLIPPVHIKHTLKDIVAAHGLRIFSIAETEKYAHVTYFFDGGREQAVSHETRVLIPSPPGRDYAANPHMSAHEITAHVIGSLEHNPHDFYLINYANPDMVGHSGNIAATITAIECIDQELKKLYELFVRKHGGIMLITGDHGKAEEMFNKDTNQPLTAHTANPVPFIALGSLPSIDIKDIQEMRSLADIAPLILRLWDIPIPQEMNQHYHLKRYSKNT